MDTEDMENVELGSWDEIEPISYVNLGLGKVTVRFTTDVFTKGVNKFKKTTYAFSVVEGKSDKILTTTSKRLMLKLKELIPLEGKVLEIERIGTGMDTDYLVKEVV